MAQRLKHLSAMRETWVRSLGREDSPGEGNGNPLQYSCLGNPMDGGALVSYSPWGHKESDTTEQLHFLSNGGVIVNFLDAGITSLIIPAYHREPIIINDVVFLWQPNVSIPIVSVPRASILSPKDVHVYKVSQWITENSGKALVVCVCACVLL